MVRLATELPQISIRVLEKPAFNPYSTRAKNLTAFLFYSSTRIPTPLLPQKQRWILWAKFQSLFFFFWTKKHVLLSFLKAHRHYRDRMRGTRHPNIQSQTQIWQSSCLNNTQIILHEQPLSSTTTNKSSKYLCTTKTLWDTQSTREYTNSTEKTQNNRATVGEEFRCRRDSAWRPRAIPGVIPARPTTREHRTAPNTAGKAERGSHARPKAETTLARASHAPSKEDPHGRGWRRLDRKKTGRPVEGRVSWRNRQQAVDLTWNAGDAWRKTFPKANSRWAFLPKQLRKTKKTNQRKAP